MKSKHQSLEEIPFPSCPEEGKKVGKDLNTFKPSLEVLLTFKENRSFDLHLGRTIIIFKGRETKKISANLLSHKDFTEVIKKKFVIKEVNNE